MQMIHSAEQTRSITPNQLYGNKFRRTAGALLVSAFALSACGGGNEKPPTPTEVVTTYRERDLLCRSYVVEDMISNPSVGYDCDFAGFYANPNYKAPAGIERAEENVFKEHEVSYAGSTLHCLVYSVTKKKMPAETCDFVRYHNPTLG